MPKFTQEDDDKIAKYVQFCYSTYKKIDWVDLNNKLSNSFTPRQLNDHLIYMGDVILEHAISQPYRDNEASMQQLRTLIGELMAKNCCSDRHGLEYDWNQISNEILKTNTPMCAHLGKFVNERGFHKILALYGKNASQRLNPTSDLC